MSEPFIDFDKPKSGGPPPVPQPFNSEKIRQGKKKEALAALSELPRLPEYALREWQKEPEMPLVSLLPAELGPQGMEAYAYMRKKVQREKAERGEDAVIFSYDRERNLLLFGAADGLGGEGEKGKGAEASCDASGTVTKRFSALVEASDATNEELRDELIEGREARKSDPNSPERDFKAWEFESSSLIRHAGLLRRAILAAHEKICKDQDDPKKRGKTTLSLGLVVHERGRIFLITGNVGDSGVIISSGATREARLATEDDSFLVRGDKLGIVTTAQLEMIRNNKRMRDGVRSATIHALGQESALEDGRPRVFAPDIAIHELQPGDTVCATSDGLIKDLRASSDGEEIPAQRFAPYMQEPEGLKAGMQYLVDTSKDRSRDPSIVDDDKGMVMVRVGEYEVEA